MSSSKLFFRLAHCVSFGVSLFAASSLCAPNAWAQGVDEFGAYGPKRDTSITRDSPESFAFELRGGPYLPQVDSEFKNGETPFRDYFGTKHRVAIGMELDWLPLVVKNVLRVGPGVGVMYTAIGADAFLAQEQKRRAVGQTTSLRVLPHWVTAVVRLDALDRLTPIPLTFTAKFGFAHALWFSKDQPRTADAADGTKPKGRSWGLYYGAGAALDLGFLDSSSRKRLDAFLGINRVYFFGELYGLKLDGFEKSNVMVLSDHSWVLGLAFDL
jgi:hypothetical protein